MRKFSIGSTAACLALAVSACTVAPVSEEENIGTDSEALSTAFTEECSEPVEFPPYYPPSTEPSDSDEDGVFDAFDFCPGTEIPEDVPLRRLGIDRFALQMARVINGKYVFDTRLSNGRLAASRFSIVDTGGCSCDQILDALGGDRNQSQYGCNFGTIVNWVRLVEKYP
ncbi:MAG: hypothetical protein IPM54_06025 [Polyangiaceae bacterium]|nr:hypothetical protein [Polyangiaceae bacterium]